MVRQDFNSDWAFSLRNWLGDRVEKTYRADRHRWPTLASFDAKVYRCGQAARLFVIRDKPAGVIPSIFGSTVAEAWPDQLPKVENPFSQPNLKLLLDEVYKHFDLRQQDYAVIIPAGEGSSVQEDVQEWYIETEQAFEFQMDVAINRQLHYVRGFDQVGNFFLPPGYDFLSKDCERFLNDHPNYEQNVFLMTRFASGDKTLVSLDVELRRVLREHDLNPVRADDKMYLQDRNLWNNVCVYMLCCGKGIAILEDRLADEFNPNVALEYGFMRALNRPTLLLADKGFRNLRADVIGTLRETFDLMDIESTVQPAIERWMGDFR